MGKQRKSVHDEILLSSSVNELDPDLPLVASQAAMLLARSKSRMDSDRRDGRGPSFYKDGFKVLYRLGDVLAERVRIREAALEDGEPQASRLHFRRRVGLRKNC